MQQIFTRRHVLTLLATLICYAAVITAVVLFLERAGRGTSTLPAGLLPGGEVIGAALSLWSISTPWRWGRRLEANAQRFAAAGRPLWALLIWLCLVPFGAPVIYGLTLYFLGMPPSGYGLFVAASLLAALAWSVPRLRGDGGG